MFRGARRWPVNTENISQCNPWGGDSVPAEEMCQIAFIEASAEKPAGVNVSGSEMDRVKRRKKEIMSSWESMSSERAPGWVSGTETDVEKVVVVYREVEGLGGWCAILVRVTCSGPSNACDVAKPHFETSKKVMALRIWRCTEIE